MTANPDAGQLRLYINGKLQGEAQLESVSYRRKTVCFGQPKWGPAAGFALDEVTFRERALPEKEVEELAKMNGALIRRRALSSLVKLRVMERLHDLGRAVLLTEDLFNPLLHPSRVFSSGLPSHALLLSSADIRALNKYHNNRLRNGLNDLNSTSVKRKMRIAGRGGTCEAVIELIGKYTAVPGGRGQPRKTFVVETAAGDGSADRRKLLFRPPEGTPFLIEILAGELAARCGYPASALELCALRFNQTFEGVYLCRDLAGDRGLTWAGLPEPWSACLLRLPLSRQEIMDAFDRCAARYSTALRADRKSPLASREIAFDILRQREQLQEAMSQKAERFDLSDEPAAGRILDYLGEDLFLNGNPHPSYIVKDIDLSLTNLFGARIEYRSLAPDVLGDGGRITPPESAPVPAGLDVTVRSGSAAKSKTLKFVVMPERRKLPLLRVDSFGSFSAEDVSACSIEFLEDEGRSSGMLGGHIRLRGNTSLVRTRKKYYFIKLDEPRSFGEVPKTRRLMLTSAYRDPTFMRDKLSYDIFRNFSEPVRPRYAPHVQHVELVLNGVYMGIYGISDRVDGDMLRFQNSSLDRSEQPLLYKAIGSHANFDHVSPGDYVQKIPDWKNGPFLGPYETLMCFLGQADRETFREKAERLIDVDNIIDFEILLLVTCNMEGQDVNLYIARDQGPAARFFLVPWDYDMTYRKTLIPSNHLIQRLHRDLPGYTRRFKARWEGLRKHRLSEAALMKRIDDMEDVLREGVARNFERWPIEPGLTHHSEVQALRDWLKSRLVQMDQVTANMAEQD